MTFKPSETQFVYAVNTVNAFLISRLSMHGNTAAILGACAFSFATAMLYNKVYFEYKDNYTNAALSFPQSILITNALSSGNTLVDSCIFGLVKTITPQTVESIKNRALAFDAIPFTPFLTMTSLALAFNLTRSYGLFGVANCAFESVTGIKAPIIAEGLFFALVAPTVEKFLYPQFEKVTEYIKSVAER